MRTKRTISFFAPFAAVGAIAGFSVGQPLTDEAGIAPGAGPGDEPDFLVFVARVSYEEVVGITPESDENGLPRYPMPRNGDVRDFEEAALQIGQVVFLNDPLEAGVPNNGFPTGLAEPGLELQSNRSPTGLQLDPRGPMGLFGANAAAPFVSVVVTPRVGLDGLDLLISGSEPVYAIGFDVVTSVPTPNVRIRVFDAGNALIGEFTAVGTPAGQFFGIVQEFGVSPPAIARVNLTALEPGGLPAMVREGADNVDMRLSAP